MSPSKYLSNFWRTLGMLLTNCEIILMSNMAANQKKKKKKNKITVTDTKLCSGCTFINSRYCKATTTIEIRTQIHS